MSNRMDRGSRPAVGPAVGHAVGPDAAHEPPPRMRRLVALAVTLAVTTALAQGVATTSPLAHSLLMRQSNRSQLTARTGLTAAPKLARVYDAIFDAQFSQVPALLADACGGPAPRLESTSGPSGLAPHEACQLLALVSLWWQIQLDPLNPARDAEFRRSSDAVVIANQAWTLREPLRAEAWFYLGGAYGARVQFRALRGERLAAARDGTRVKDALDEAIRLDAGLHDAFFGMGLYHYYADVANPAAKILRRLLFLPGGDRALGLREMERARDRGAVVSSEAAYQLHLAYLWYEQQPDRARELLRSLRARHPRNPHFTQLVAEVEDVYLGDITESLRSWESLLAAAQERRIAEPLMAATRARLGLALQLDRLHETDRALDHLRAIIREEPTAPYGALAQTYLQLAHSLDRLGLRSDAVAAYRAAAAASPTGDPLRTSARARIGLRDTPPAASARAYRLSLEGWRALERGAVDDAARTIGQALALAPKNAVIRYRYARVLLAQKNEPAALAVLEGIATEGTTEPAPFYGASCLEAARIHERRGDVVRAVDLYRLAATAFAVDRQVKEQAERALARLNASTTTESSSRQRARARSSLQDSHARAET